MTVDLRSDTVTRPSLKMWQAIAEAEVGDDTRGDDPTVKALEDKVAHLLGKEAGVFVTSGKLNSFVLHFKQTLCLLSFDKCKIC